MLKRLHIRLNEKGLIDLETWMIAGLPSLFDDAKCRQRNIKERMLGWLKESRYIVTRFDRFARSFAAMFSSGICRVVR